MNHQTVKVCVAGEFSESARCPCNSTTLRAIFAVDNLYDAARASGQEPEVSPSISFAMTHFVRAGRKADSFLRIGVL